MTQKKIFSEESVQETMLGPLWARAKYSAEYPELLDDPKAREIIEKIDYDFSEIENYLGEWRGLGLLARAKNFDLVAKNYIQNFPEATIINLGAGLDTTFSRIDNGRIRCLNLDLPEGAGFRKSLIPDTPRNKTIAKSVFDFTWFDEIQFEESKGIFLIAGGFIYYFKEKKIKSLFQSLAEHVTNGEMVFDATSKLANKVLNLRAKFAGEKEVRMHFGVKNPEKIFPKWSPHIELKEWYTIWSKIEINPEWRKKTIKAIKKSERIKAAKIIHLAFIE